MRLLPALGFVAVLFMCRVPLWPWLIASFFIGYSVSSSSRKAASRASAEHQKKE